MKDYLKITYSEKRAPKSKYPSQLANYLSRRFGLLKGMHFLELGCGRGDFLKEFNKLGLICTGIDRDKNSKSFANNLDIRIADLNETFPFNDNYFDIVFHKSVIEHFYSPDHLMKETFRVLKPGGKIIILTPEWVSQMKIFYEDITHCRPYDVSALRDTLTLYGFNNIIVEKFYQYPPIWTYPFIKYFSLIINSFVDVRCARWLTEKTKIKYFRWSKELMVLGYGEK